MWFVARLLCRRDISDDVKVEDFYEEKLIVFKALDQNDVRRRLPSIQSAQEERFLNEDGNVVSWKFHEFLEVQEVVDDEIDDGTEVYYRHWHAPSSSTLKCIRHTHSSDRWWALDGPEANT
jgi:hypothetical protein